MSEHVGELWNLRGSVLTMVGAERDVPINTYFWNPAMMLARVRSSSTDIVLVGLEQSGVTLEATDCGGSQTKTRTERVPSIELRP